MAQQKKELPKLPYGEGTMQWFNEDTILYRKTVDLYGRKKRISVYGKSVRDVRKKMKEKEEELKPLSAEPNNATLAQDMGFWITMYKAPTLKPSSYDRLETTYNKQIKETQIGNIRWSQLTSDDIQRHLSSLVKEEYSWSTIKKVYDLFNNYFNFKLEGRVIQYSPMTRVVMPSRDNVLKATKSIQYIKSEQIPAFKEEALRTYPYSGRYVYKYGMIFVFLIYTGIRVGELIALQWKDIDFNKRLMTINKSTEVVRNRSYDYSKPDKMKKQGIKKYTKKTGTTKNYSERIISLNEKAMEMIQAHFASAQYKAPDDFVVATRDGCLNNPNNLDRSLSAVLRSSCIDIDQAGCHILRHTCASLLFQAGLQVEFIASILGHSPEVCRKTYIHFCQQQQAAAIHKIAEFNI